MILVISYSSFRRTVPRKWKLVLFVGYYKLLLFLECVPLAKSQDFPVTVIYGRLVGPCGDVVWTHDSDDWHAES